MFRLDAADALNSVTLAQPDDEPEDSDDEPEHDSDDELEEDADDEPEDDAADEAEVAAEPVTRDDAARYAAVAAERDELQARCDLLELEYAELHVALAAAQEAQEPGAFNAAVHQRATLLRKAERALGEDFRFDGLSEREIHEAVLRKLNPHTSTSYASEDSAYLRGLFDSAIDGGTRNHSLDRARRVTTSGARQDLQPRTDAKPYVPHWLRPTSITKTRPRQGDR